MGCGCALVVGEGFSMQLGMGLCGSSLGRGFFVNISC